MVKIVTKYEIEVTEYDSTGYYYPEYKTIQKVISESVAEAEKEAIKRTPKINYGWNQKTRIISSEDIVINPQSDHYAKG